MSKTVTKSAVVEAIKEVARLALFAAAAAVVAYLTDRFSGLSPDNTFVIVATALLRFADKWLHENKNVKANGLTPF